MSYNHEIEQLRRDTLVMIANDGRSVTLTRPGTGWERAPDGGQRRTGTAWDLAPAPRWFQLTTGDARFFVPEHGERLESDAVLVGPPGDDVVKGDTFSMDGCFYKVIWVHSDRRYEMRARCQVVT